MKKAKKLNNSKKEFLLNKFVIAKLSDSNQRMINGGGIFVEDTDWETSRSFSAIVYAY